MVLLLSLTVYYAVKKTIMMEGESDVILEMMR